jgi:hypothetical protein
MFQFELEQLFPLLSLLETKIMHCFRLDRKIWTLNTNGLYTVQSSSYLLDQLLYGGVQPFQSSIWLKDAP